jgi:uncharacterized membrane protein HdeD (DUF308 family)
MKMAAMNPYNSFDLRAMISDHWVLFLIYGMTLVILGMLALGAPVITTLAVEDYAGWLFVIGGIFGLASVIYSVPRFWWGLLTAFLAIAIGAYLIQRPFAGVLSLTMAVGIYFAAQGVIQVVTAVGHRSTLASWMWLLVSGVVNLFLAAIILLGLPGTAAWTLGLLLGVSLMMWGLSLVMTALSCRSNPGSHKAGKIAA